MIELLFPASARAGASLADVAPSALVTPALFGMVFLLLLPIAFLPAGYARLRRSLALLALLVSVMGLMMTSISLPLGTGLSLAIFLAIFAVFYLLGRFDAPD